MAITGAAEFTKKLQRKTAELHSARKKKANDFEIRLPVGDYVAKLSDVTFKETKNGDPFVSMKFTVVSPKETECGFAAEGKDIWITHFLNESQFATYEENLTRLTQDLQRMGVDVSQFEPADVAEAFEDLLSAETDVRVRVTLSKKGNKFVIIRGLADPADIVVDTSDFKEEGKADINDFDEIGKEDEEAPFDADTDDFDVQAGKIWEYTVDDKTGAYEILAVDFKEETLTLKMGRRRKEISFHDGNLGDEVTS